MTCRTTVFTLLATGLLAVFSALAARTMHPDAVILNLNDLARETAPAGAVGAAHQAEASTVSELPAMRLAGGPVDPATLDRELGYAPRQQAPRGTVAAVEARWLKAYAAWYLEFLFRMNARYRADAFDCDDFARTFSTFTRTARGAGIDARPLIGMALVRQDRAWAGQAAGGHHAVVIAATDRGWMVVEPQNGRMVRLDRYPNAETIYFINWS
jgi:hypothetical protein